MHIKLENCQISTEMCHCVYAGHTHYNLRILLKRKKIPQYMFWEGGGEGVQIEI